MSIYLLDTNHLSQCLNKVSRLRDRVHKAHRSGARFGSCVPALCELEVFVVGSIVVEQSHRALKRLARYVRILPLEPDMARAYADIYLDLRRRGRVMSQVDMMLAAMARWKDCTLLTSDRDFEALSDIRCENWLLP